MRDPYNTVLFMKHFVELFSLNLRMVSKLFKFYAVLFVKIIVL